MFSFIRPILEYDGIISGSCSQYEQNGTKQVQVETNRIVSDTNKVLIAPLRGPVIKL